MSQPEDFEYDEDEQLSIPEFHKKFKDKLPLMVIVTEGFYGETKYDDYSGDQIIRLHRATQQLRALGRLSSAVNSYYEEYVTIPVEGVYKFAVVKSSKKVGDPMSMEEILAQHQLPVQVKYASYNRELPYSLGCLKESNILIMRTYVEDYIQGNCLQNDKLSQITCLLALCPEISVSVITGFSHKTRQEFENTLQSFDEFTKNKVKFKENEGNPDITRFQRGDQGTGTGNLVPPDLLVDDFYYASVKDVPPTLVPRKKENINKQLFEDDEDLYEMPPEPTTYWTPIVPAKTYVPEGASRPTLPSRPRDKIGTGNAEGVYSFIEANETPGQLVGDDNYTYISDSMGDTSDYSSKDSWSAGSSRSHVTGKSVQDVIDILGKLNLSKFADEFRSNLIDGAVLEDLNEGVLRSDFKFKHVEAVRLMKYVRSGHIPK